MRHMEMLIVILCTILSAVMFSYALAGCAISAQSAVYKASTTTAIVAGECYHAIDRLDDVKQLQARAKASLGDIEGARAAMKEWMPRYDAVYAACKAAQMGAQSAFHAANIMGNRGSFAKWVAELTGLTAKVIDALASVGIRLEAK